MSMASLDIDPQGQQWIVCKPHGGRITSTRSEGSSVIHVDRSQEKPVPPGAELLDAYLDRMEAMPDIAEHLPSARRELAGDYRNAGNPITLRQLRLDAGMSQKGLAGAIGTSQNAVSEYESRARKPAEDTIRNLVQALSVDFNTLMEALANGDG